VQHERIGVGPKIGNDERNFVRHEAADETHVAGQAIQLCDKNRAFELPGLGECGGELRATIQRVRSLAGFHIDELGGDLEILGGGEPMTPAEVSTATGKTSLNVRQLLFKMAKAGEVHKAGKGRYWVEPSNPHNSDNADNEEDE
jgi:hypothetical protein